MKALNLGQAQLELLVSHLPYFVAIVDAERRYLWVNRLDPTLKPAEVLGRRLEDFNLESERPKVVECFERALREGQPVYYEAQAYGAGAFESWYGSRIVALPPDERGAKRAMVLSHDVTERRRTAQALAQSEALLRQVVEASPDFILLIDADRRVHFANREPLPESGLTREDLVGAGAEHLVVPDDREVVRHLLSRALDHGESAATTVRGARSDHLFHVRVVPLRAETGARALIIGTDVTEEHRHRAQREVMHAELDHRVKNTLATILAITNQTLATAPSLDAFRETFVGRLQAMAHTHEALAASRWSSVKLAQLLQLTLQPFTGDPQRLALHLGDVSVPPGVVTPLALALHELATNAAKYGALAGAAGQLAVRGAVSARGELELTWEEQGAAARPEAPATGQGLGLTLVRGLVERQLHGALQLELLATGRRYTLRVPLQPRAGQAP